VSVDTTEGLARLREPFPPEHVGLLPKITCRNCSESRTRNCDQHSKKKCEACGNWITERHIHLDYVGHGAVTHRLLEVDPLWSWEPLAMDNAGMPVFICDQKLQPIAFWIRLTVCGVTRLGVGTCLPGASDAEKQLIGDALRNAAMRFGVALDLWIKGHEDDEQTAATASARPTDRQPAQRSDPLAGAEPAASKGERDAVKAAYDDLTADQQAAATAWIQAEGLPAPERLTKSQAAKALAEFLRLASPPAEGDGAEPTPSGSAPDPGTPLAQFETEAEHIADKAART
jgi:hypothetical protein